MEAIDSVETSPVEMIDTRETVGISPSSFTNSAEQIGITPTIQIEDVDSITVSPSNLPEKSVEYPRPIELGRELNHVKPSTDSNSWWELLKSYKSSYDEVVVKNAPQVASIESLLRSLTYFLPGKFKDSEFATESMFAALNVAGMYHDSVLSKYYPTSSTAAVYKQQHLVNGVGIQPTPPPSAEMSLFNRFTRAGINSSDLYKRMSYGLSTLQFLQVVIEIWARKKFGENGRWRAIILVEAIKTYLRFSLFKMSGDRLTLHPTVPERDYDVSIPLSANLTPANLTSAMTMDQQALKLRDILGEDVSKSLTDPNAERNISSFLSARSLSSPAPYRAKHLVGTTNGLRSMAEMAYMLRPLLYILLLRQNGKDSWKPWLASLLLEMSSLAVSQTTLDRKPTVLESNEYKRRSFLLLWYMLRSPMYTRWTSHRLDEFVDYASQKPLIYIIANILTDYRRLWENLFFVVNPGN